MVWTAPAAVSVLFLFNLYMVFFYAPVERTMGMVQKIFYFHLSAAWIGFFAFFVVFLASAAYLKTRQDRFDRLATASAELGSVFTTIVLLTGPLWARPVWNTWWTWDPRLTSTLVMWFMYLAYIVLQHSLQGPQRARLTSVYGIVAFVNVPLVFFSIRWWRSLHPVVIRTEGAGLAPPMVHALLFSLFTFLVLYGFLLYYRVGVLALQDKVERGTQALYEREDVSPWNF